MGTEPAAANSFIQRVTRAAVQRPWIFVGVAALLSAGSIALAAHLEIRSSFQELLPSDVPSVAQTQELIRRVGGDGTVLVNIEALDGPAGLPRAEALAPRLAEEILALGPAQIRSVEQGVSRTRDWYEQHWPLFIDVATLREARDSLRAELKRRAGAANPMAVQLDDEPDGAAPAAAAPGAKGSEWLDPKQPLPRERVHAQFAGFVDGFFVHPDHRSLTLVVRPTGTTLGVAEARALLDRMQALVDRHKAELEAGHLAVGFAGTFPFFVAEYEAILHDIGGTALLCVSLVLLSLLLFFRDLRSVLSLGVGILVAVAVTFGLTRLVIGYLTTQTAFLGAIVVGNGINYGLIYLARVRQLRAQGVALLPACLEGAQTTARATLLASAATSVSFGVLIIAANRGFRQFGFIGGVGMLLCWVATFTLVPALLSLYERVRGAPRVKTVPGLTGDSPVPGTLRGLFSAPAAIVVAFGVATALATVFFVARLPTVEERNLENLSNELRGEEKLVRENDRAHNSLGKSIAGSVALLDSRDQADAFCEAIRTRAKTPPLDALIDGCETVSRVVPRDQEQKLGLLRELRAELTDRVLSRVDAKQRARLLQVRADLDAQRPLRLEDAPPTLVDQFRERDGTVGRIAVVTAKPDAKIELGENLKNFVRGVRDVALDGKKFSATGENAIFADLLENIEREGPRTTLLSFAGVCLLVFLLFRKNVRTGAEVVGSLFVGVLLMSGIATALGLKINFFNFIVFPVTFGVAVDYGANVAARVHERRGDILGSLREVGPAVALCSWTSMIGYGSLLFSLNRALRSFGWYAVIGEMTTITTALVLLPALLLLRADRAGARQP